ncbi:MAG: CbtB-domain containing protein [Chloroflexi bacterium]|nr:CbtB-domain containing protein [Chloroflexota bacterium]
MNSVTATPVRESWRQLLALAMLGIAVLYLMGLDQGHMLSLFQGEIAFDQNFIHEAVHDARHAAGFPCH